MSLPDRGRGSRGKTRPYGESTDLAQAPEAAQRNPEWFASPPRLMARFGSYTHSAKGRAGRKGRLQKNYRNAYRKRGDGQV